MFGHAGVAGNFSRVHFRVADDLRSCLSGNIFDGCTGLLRGAAERNAQISAHTLRTFETHAKVCIRNEETTSAFGDERVSVADLAPRSPFHHRRRRWSLHS